jgi:CubicO group peptidase (beta-lactamase class C family)
MVPEVGADLFARPARLTAAPGFEPVNDAFERLLAERPGWSGSFAAYVQGAKIVDVWGGPAWNEDSLVVLASATKGLAATCIAVLVEDGAIDLDARVAEYWPEFAAAGKEAVTVRMLLSHQAGLIAVSSGVTFDEILDHVPLAAKLAAQPPAWEPGHAYSYHGVTIGPLMDELVRRVTGSPLRELFETRVATPLAAGDDVYIGLPPSEDSRLLTCVESSVPADVAAQAEPILARLASWMEQHDLVDIPIDIPLTAMVRLEENEKVWRLGFPSAAGVANARGLARVYAACVSEVDGCRLLSAETVEAVSARQTAGKDCLFQTEGAFAIGYQVSSPSDEMLGEGSFGHGGFGGCAGFAHPGHELGIGFTTNYVPPIRGADPAANMLAATLLDCLA